jgi:hypothetical protein
VGIIEIYLFLRRNKKFVKKKEEEIKMILARKNIKNRTWCVNGLKNGIGP